MGSSCMSRGPLGRDVVNQGRNIPRTLWLEDITIASSRSEDKTSGDIKSMHQKNTTASRMHRATKTQEPLDLIFTSIKWTAWTTWTTRTNRTTRIHWTIRSINTTRIDLTNRNTGTFWSTRTIGIIRTHRTTRTTRVARIISTTWNTWTNKVARTMRKF